MTVRTLIVDDEPEIQKTLSGILEDEGYAVSCAGSAEEGLRLLNKRAFELVLLDIWLPGMDGLAGLEAIRKLEDPPEVIMISGHGTIESAVRATKLGAFDFLEKPLSLDRTLVVVKNALEAKRLRLENRELKRQSRSGEIVGNSVPMKALRQQIAMFGQGQGGKEAMILNLTQQNAELQKQIDELNRRYADAIGRVGNTTALPEALSNELSAFAAQNPDIVSFDAQRGIVKFKSDVTFATGKDELSPKAKDVIQRFSQILNSPAASGYELMVAGHTDNTPVSNPATIQAGHKNNWYLSAHRAISVGTELQRSNVNPARLAVTGYADQHPVASNSSEFR